MSRGLAALKVHRPVAFAGFQLPAARSVSGQRPWKAVRRKHNHMQTHHDTTPAGIGSSAHACPNLGTPPFDPFDLVERVRARERLADIVEAALALLDAMDGSPDLEDGADAEPDADDEPSLGSPDRMLNQEQAYDMGESWLGVDREHDESEEELSLGWSNPLGACVDRGGVLIVERAPDRQVRP